MKDYYNFFQLYIVFPHFFPVKMLNGITPKCLNTILSSNTAESAKSSVLKCLKCPSVQVPLVPEFPSSQVPERSKCPAQLP